MTDIVVRDAESSETDAIAGSRWRVLELEHVTVHPSPKANPLYERIGLRVSPRDLGADLTGG